MVPNHSVEAPNPSRSSGQQGCRSSATRYAAATTRLSRTYDEFSGPLEPEAAVLAAVHRPFVAPTHVPHPAWHDAYVRADGPVVHPVHDSDLVPRRFLRVSGNGAWQGGWCPANVTEMGPDCVALHRVDRLVHLLVGGTPAGCCIG